MLRPDHGTCCPLPDRITKDLHYKTCSGPDVNTVLFFICKGFLYVLEKKIAFTQTFHIICLHFAELVIIEDSCLFDRFRLNTSEFRKRSA